MVNHMGVNVVNPLLGCLGMAVECEQAGESKGGHGGSCMDFVCGRCAAVEWWIIGFTTVHCDLVGGTTHLTNMGQPTIPNIGESHQMSIEPPTSSCELHNRAYSWAVSAPNQQQLQVPMCASRSSYSLITEQFPITSTSLTQISYKLVIIITTNNYWLPSIKSISEQQQRLVEWDQNAGEQFRSTDDSFNPGWLRDFQSPTYGTVSRTIIWHREHAGSLQWNFVKTVRFQTYGASSIYLKK